MNRLGVRLFLLITGTVVAVTFAYDLLRLQRERALLARQLEREVSLVARAAERPFQVWMQTGEPEALEALLRDVREAQGATCVGIYAPGGARILAAREEGLVEGAAGDCPARRDEALGTDSALSRWNPLGTFGVAAPLSSGPEGVTSLKMVLPSTVVTDPLRRHRNVILTERGVVLAAIALILWPAIAVGFGRPIRRLMRGVEELTGGNLQARIDVRSRTEIGELARAFNRMAERLDEARRRAQAEEERRTVLERQLRHADKLAVIGKLASEVAHEVGSPLNVISGRARMLRRTLPEADPRVETLDIIARQVDRISRVIRRLLDVARPARTRRDPVDLRPVIREVAAFVAPELRRKQVRLALALPAALPPVAIDSDAFSQVLLNLILNALAALSPGGHIELAAATAPASAVPSPEAGEPPGEGALIRVTDDGHGIPPEILPRVFEPFFSTKPGEGTGLGLSICRDIVREHGGRIALQSHPGAGTSALVWLPLADSRGGP